MTHWWTTPARRSAREIFGAIAALLGIGIVYGLPGAAPSIVWASGVVFAAAFFVLVPLAIWLYPGVRVFLAVVHAHYGLAALQRLRAERGTNMPMAEPALRRLVCIDPTPCGHLRRWGLRPLSRPCYHLPISPSEQRTMTPAFGLIIVVRSCQANVPTSTYPR